MVFIAILSIIVAYLIGSVNFAVIYTSAFVSKDVRKYGSGNAGSTNALRVGGKASGILTFVCDFLKGAICSYFGIKIFEYIFDKCGASWAMPAYGAYLCGIACLIGHVYPVFFGFKGGKGVATGVGLFLPICPLATLVGLVSFTGMVVLSGIVSISSILAAVLVVITALSFGKLDGELWIQTILALIALFIVEIRHKDNIKRLIKGEEKRILKRGKKNGKN